MPSRSLYYPNIVKGECRKWRKRSFRSLAMPSRSLYYPNIVKGECREWRKRSFQKFGYAEPQPILSKYSERRVQRVAETKFSDLAMPSRSLYNKSEAVRQTKRKGNANSTTYICIAPTQPDTSCQETQRRGSGCVVLPSITEWGLSWMIAP